MDQLALYELDAHLKGKMHTPLLLIILWGRVNSQILFSKAHAIDQVGNCANNDKFVHYDLYCTTLDCINLVKTHASLQEGD